MKIMGMVAFIVIVGLLSPQLALAACGPTCQAKCREAASAGAEPSYNACLQKWSAINAKGKAYAAEKEAEARLRWQKQQQR